MKSFHVFVNFSLTDFYSSYSLICIYLFISHSSVLHFLNQNHHTPQRVHPQTKTFIHLKEEKHIIGGDIVSLEDWLGLIEFILKER